MWYNKNTKIYLFFVFLFGFFALIGLFLILTLLNPDAGALNLFLFYADFGILCLMLGTLFGYYLRQRFGQREFKSRHFTTAARQGLWFAILLTGSMYMLAHNLFNLVNTGLFILCLTFLEFFIMSKQKKLD